MLSAMENAIRCFERWSDTQVTLYDQSGEFAMLLEPERFTHRQACCRQGKVADEKRCMFFDLTTVSREVWQHRDGMLKICHAGLLEWVVPLFRNGRLRLILNAGSRRPGGDFHSDGCFVLRDGATPAGSSTVAAGEIPWVLEGLRQLAARLGELAQTALTPAVPPTRRAQIHIFLLRHCRGKTGIRDLAAALHLSESRTLHAVREETGYGFRELLLTTRLRLAALRLQVSTQPVAEIARTCGFGDTATFHRAFKRRFGHTPLQYRKQLQRLSE